MSEKDYLDALKEAEQEIKELKKLLADHHLRIKLLEEKNLN